MLLACSRRGAESSASAPNEAKRRATDVPSVAVMATSLAVDAGAPPGGSTESSAAADAPPELPAPASPSVSERAANPADRSAEALALDGLDVTRMRIDNGAATAPLSGGRTARLSIDPTLQRVALSVMRKYRVPEAAVVLMDVATGKVLVYASHVQSGERRDLCAEATAPAASVFKVVTASALVEQAGLQADHRQCYSGGEHRITAGDLVPNPRRDRTCDTLAGAMGHSINTIFARLSVAHLRPEELEAQARAFAFGGPFDFDVPVQASALRVPTEKLEFARTSAGFWNTTLSPVHAAWLSATIARGGEAVRPTLVSDVVSSDGGVQSASLFRAAPGGASRRVIRPATAKAVSTMMETTVTEGTSARAFRAPGGESFLPNVPVAGKTGTLTDASKNKYYTWFTGFTPSRADAATSVPRVAIGALVVNRASWTIKANVLAREVLRAYFAQHHAPGVTMPRAAAESDDNRSVTARERDEVARGRHDERGTHHLSTTPVTKHRRQRGS